MSIRTLGPSENARPPRVLQLAVAGSVILMMHPQVLDATSLLQIAGLQLRRFL